ncbi:MAG: helix-hairpin-helix domain-containing protein [Candidatus Promineifilaceae bacterium]
MSAAYIPWITFFIGVFVGWLLTWLIMVGNRQDLEGKVAQLEKDLQATEVELALAREESAEEAAKLKAQIKDLKRDLKEQAGELKGSLADLESRAAEAAACAKELAALQGAFAALQASLPEQAGPELSMADRAQTIDIMAAAPEVDDFTKIKGIGPALAARLAAARIYTYADLANADAETLPDALGVQPWQKVEPTVWISEAAVLAEQPKQVHIGDDLTMLEGIGPTYATRLRAAGILTFEQLAESNEQTIAVVIGAPPWRRDNYGDWIAQARLAVAGDEAGLKELQDKLHSRQGDNLLLISGVGPQSLAVLHDGGFNSYSALSDADPDALAVLFKDAGVRAGDLKAWIAEAKLRAAGKRVQRSRHRLPKLEAAEFVSCPQDLELIDGIGTVYEQRLYEAGVGSFWEVGMLPEALLSEILEAQAFQDVDFAAIKAGALHLAEETGSMGRVWDGTEPDNFEPLEGIGPVLERRLYAAGICTYEALASATVERLREVCHAPAFQHVDYGLWIKQAKELVAQP